MKKFTRSIIAVFAIATTLVSCTKDEPTNSIQGKWILDESLIMMPGKEPQPFDLDGTCAEKNYFDLKKGGISEEGRVDPQTCKVAKLNGTWKETNNSLDIQADSEDPITFEVASVTANKLVLILTALGPNAPAGTYVEATFSK